MPVRISYSINVKKSVFSLGLHSVGSDGSNAFSIDAAVDDDMRNVQTLRSELSGSRLDEHAQSRFRSAEMPETGSASP